MNKVNMDSMLDAVKKIFNETQTVIDSIADGGRKQIEEVAEVVSVALNTDSKEVLSFVNHYLHKVEQFGIGYVTRGKMGGFIKGIRPVKVIKTPAVAPVNMAPLDLMINELDSEESVNENDVEDIAV